MSEANAKTNEDPVLDGQEEAASPEAAQQEAAQDGAVVAGTEADRADAALEQFASEDLQAQLKQADDRTLRAQAELENFRKRARRDMDEQRRYSNLALVGDLLPALDNLDRAVEAAAKDESSTGLLAGVKMVAEQIRSILAQHSCVPIETEGRPFDPNVHEAIAQESSATVPAGHVTRVLRMGYLLHERVIRPAQVMVSTGPIAETPDPATEDALGTSNSEEAGSP